MAQRLTIKQSKNPHVKVGTMKFGLIACGISREILIRIHAMHDIIGKFKSSFKIITKHNIYTIPILAKILEPANFETLSQQTKQVGKKAFRTKVRQIRMKKGEKRTTTFTGTG